MGSRWKGKGAEAKALSDPMSQINSQLQSCLIKSNSSVLLTTSGSLLEADAELTELLKRACFGCPIITAEKDKQWFHLSTEETFYVFHVLKCIKVVGGDMSEKSCEELWTHMNLNRHNFPNLFKAYSHLRKKNWVVRSGLQYGVDFVAYRHHPSLVHSEYAVLVLSGDGDPNARLLVWSDVLCTLRLCRGVNKTLLVIYVDKCGKGSGSPLCLDSYIVEERTITQWSPEQPPLHQSTSARLPPISATTAKPKTLLCAAADQQPPAHEQTTQLPALRMGSRWKGKGAEALALSDPMSQIVSQLQSCLIKSNSSVLLTTSGSSLEADAELTELLKRACFGHEKGNQWFHLSTEETFYLSHVLKCIKVVGEDMSEKSCEELWAHMNLNRDNFPNLIKAYSHLRKKNWVVRSGLQYGVDFVAYIHHPSRVHSKYAVIVLSGDGDPNARLLVWSDLWCTLRLSRNVNKTLLVIYVDKCGKGSGSPLCLDSYIVEERTITQWSPEQCREESQDQATPK